MLFSPPVIGKRGARALRWALTQKENYLAVIRALRILESPLSLIRDEVLSRSLRSQEVGVRTPVGRVRVRLNSSADLSTLFGVFCRADYHSGSDLRVAIDVGANIGIATLYFLTRSPAVFVHAFEPVPLNGATFRTNVAPFGNRCELAAAAVGARAGTVSFGVEPTGKFGGIGTPHSARIDVPCVAINDVLEGVLSRHSRVDVLKIDVEGTEEEIIAAIAPELWMRVGRIYAENSNSTAYLPPGFRRTFRYNVECLSRG